MANIPRKLFIMVPMAVGVIGLGYYLLGSGDPTLSQVQSIDASGASAQDMRMGGSPAVSAQEMMAGQEAPSAVQPVDANVLPLPPGHPANQGPGSGPAPAHEGTVAGDPQDLSMPEPIFSENPNVPKEEHLAEVTRRAVQGADPRDRAVALLELAVIGDVGVLDTLGEALMDDSAQVRAAAVISAQRLAEYKGDEGGDIRRWLVQVGYNRDASVAARARAAANQLAANIGEPLPFP